MKKDKRPDGFSRMEKQISLVLMKAGVIGPDIDVCLEWAFGKDPLSVPIYPDWVDRWRILHPQFPVDPKKSFVEWLYVVGFLFTQYQYAQKKNYTLN